MNDDDSCIQKWDKLNKLMQRHNKLCEKGKSYYKTAHEIIQTYADLNLPISIVDGRAVRQNLAGLINELQPTWARWKAKKGPNMTYRYFVFEHVEKVEADWALVKFLQIMANESNPTTIHNQLTGLLQLKGQLYSYFLAYVFTKIGVNVGNVEIEFTPLEKPFTLKEHEKIIVELD